MRPLRAMLYGAALYIAGVGVTLVAPLGYRSGDAAERAYVANARGAHAYINDNPVSRPLARPIVIRTEVTDLYRLPGSCQGGIDQAFPDNAEVVRTVIDYGVWAIPLRRYTTSCGGLSIARGRPAASPPLPTGEEPR